MDQEDGYLWKLEFWDNSNGNSPAEESFSKMVGKDRDLEKGIAKSVKQLRRYSVEQMSITNRLEKVEGGLSELKISTVKKEVRFLGCFGKVIL